MRPESRSVYPRNSIRKVGCASKAGNAQKGLMGNRKADEWMRVPGMVLLALGVYVAAELTFSPILSAQEDTSSSVELGIIVVPTLDKAEEAFKKLKAGTDFCVLAKEVSVDPSAAGGGYLGRLSPVQLLPELRDALIGVQAG